VRTVRSIAELREALPGEGRIGLVPTMGFFHEGHLSLMRAARARCDVVVVSLFVNPTQFAAGEDLGAYPRDEERDRRLSAVLEGDPGRRGAAHFRGVTTVVTKLFNMVGPDVAYFGQKDAQQALVIRKMARDLDMPVEIEVLPTVRDEDGLALSSRNAYLSPEERDRALAIGRALRAADAAVAEGRRDAAAVLAAARGELDAAGIEPDYLELRSADDLSPAQRVNGRTLLAVAARIGRARLIDNTILGAGQ
jgi:pantoate--beta-alanine ligase